MKRSADMQAVVDRMAAGALCRDGFLAADARTLEEILDADAAAFAAHDVTPGQLADRLERIHVTAVAAFGNPVDIAPGLSAVWREAMGRIPSPWPGEGTFAKGEVELTVAATGETIRFTELSIHLLRRHTFCQGRGSRYRLEPGVLCGLLASNESAPDSEEA